MRYVLYQISILGSRRKIIINYYQLVFSHFRPSRPVHRWAEDTVSPAFRLRVVTARLVIHHSFIKQRLVVVFLCTGFARFLAAVTLYIDTTPHQLVTEEAPSQSPWTRSCILRHSALMQCWAFCCAWSFPAPQIEEDTESSQRSSLQEWRIYRFDR